jgi:CRISPR/Cas system-associated exonuclease Cas4 (RecB family)
MKCAICGVDLTGELYPAKCVTGCGAFLCDDCSLTNQFKCLSCNGKTVPKIDLEYVRRSYIETYKICPHAFKLLAIDGIETPSSIYAEIGIKLHELFEQASLGQIDKLKMHSEFLKWFSNFTLDDFEGYQRLLDTEEFRKREYAGALTSIENYFQMESEMPAPFKTEDTLFTVIHPDLPKIRITYDRINKDENGYYDLVDYKTGKVHVGQKLKNDLQVPLYIYSVQQNLGIEINRFVLLFTKENKKRIYTRVDEDTFVCTVGKVDYYVYLSKAIDEIISIFTQVSNGKTSIPHNLSPWYCENMCMLKRAGHCGGKLVQRWQG